MIGIGIDIGGTFIKATGVDIGGRIIRTAEIPTMPQKGPTDFIKRVAALVNGWRNDFGGKVCVGLGVAGDVDPENGVVRFSPNLNKWRNIRLAAGIKKLTGACCLVENDATMAAWGAYAYELRRKFDSVITVTLGTGIGGGIVLNGKLMHGATGSAGEIGHIRIAEDGEQCNCGRKGCFEAYAGHYAIVRRVNREISRRGPAAAKLKSFLGGQVSAQRLADAAGQGDALAKSIWRRTGLYLGAGIANACLLLNPDTVVLTGGVSKAHKFFMPSLKKVLAEQRIATPFKHLKIFVSKTPNLGSVGAALFALDRPDVC